MTDSTSTPLPGLHVLRLLQVARANMPHLVAAERGEGGDGRDFYYPSDDDLRVAAEKALRDAGLILVPDEDAMHTDGGDAVLRWQLVHLETGDARTYKLTWGRFTEESRTSAAAAWATAATWSHATRHLLLKLLNVRVISRAEHARLSFERRPGAPEASSDLDRLCGEMPAWASTAPVPAPAPVPASPAGLLAAIEGMLEGAAQLGAAAGDAGRRQLDAIPVLLEPVAARVRALLQLAAEAPPPAAALPAPVPAPPADPRPFDRLKISEPLRRWKEREHAVRRAAAGEAFVGETAPTMADAWAAASGGAARQPVNGEEFARLLDYLLAEDARHGGAS